MKAFLYQQLKDAIAIYSAFFKALFFLVSFLVGIELAQLIPVPVGILFGIASLYFLFKS